MRFRAHRALLTQSFSLDESNNCSLLSSVTSFSPPTEKSQCNVNASSFIIATNFGNRTPAPAPAEAEAEAEAEAATRFRTDNVQDQQ